MQTSGLMETTARLRATPTFRDGGHARWSDARLAVIGAGTLGSRFAIEAVRSGAPVSVCDPDTGEPGNLGTQLVHNGVSKVQSVVEACEAIRRGSATGWATDVRHVGIGELNRCGLLIDCTDDPRLALPLTEIANGLAKPLLRLALDGSGRREMGRVLCSDGGNGGACQVCHYGIGDLLHGVEPTPCPGRPEAERPPTLAGGALAMTIAGFGLLQAQRIITGNDLELVRNRETIIDWSAMQLFSAELQRSDDCISRHQTWELIAVPGGVETICGVFDAAAARLGTNGFTLEGYGHPLCLEASCRCGHRQLAVGTEWADAPDCPHCSEAMTRETEMQLTRFALGQAERLGILNRRIDELGFPETGAMFVARADGKPPTRLVLT